MIVSLIAAVSKNGVIGNRGALPWYITADLRHFKQVTSGHTVIMGRKTYDSIIASLGKPLPNRTNIVITHASGVQPPGPLVASSLQQALNMAADKGEQEVFVIGGEQIYKLALPYAHRLYITRVNADISGDVMFPRYNTNEWSVIQNVPHPKDATADYDITFITLERTSEPLQTQQ